MPGDGGALDLEGDGMAEVKVGTTVLVNVPTAVQQSSGMAAVAPATVTEVDLASNMVAVTAFGATVGHASIILRNLVAGDEKSAPGSYFVVAREIMG